MTINLMQLRGEYFTAQLEIERVHAEIRALASRITDCATPYTRFPNTSHLHHGGCVSEIKPLAERLREVIEQEKQLAAKIKELKPIIGL